jgi:SAM-dependent methyltransferase
MTTTTAPTAEQQYDAVADDYDRLIRPKYDAIAALVVDLVRDLTDVRRAHVVEVSAGTGALTHQLAPLARSYVATDVSEPMMAVARSHAVPGTERVTWRRADVEDLPLERASADVVASSLGPVQDSDRALAEARRVLRPGAVLAGVTWGDDYRELELLQAARRRLGLPPRTTTSAADLSARLHRAGYRQVAVRGERLPVIHASVPAYLDYRQAFGPVRDPLAPGPDDSLRALADAAAAYTDADGRVALDWHLLVFSAIR